MRSQIFDIGYKISIKITEQIMLCCQDCTLETDATLTTVLFIDQMSAQRQQIMTQYAHKHMKNIRNKNNIKQHVGGKEDNIHIE